MYTQYLQLGICIEDGWWNGVLWLAWRHILFNLLSGKFQSPSTKCASHSFQLLSDLASNLVNLKSVTLWLYVVLVILQAKLAQEIFERLQSSNPDEKRNSLSALSTISEVRGLSEPFVIRMSKCQAVVTVLLWWHSWIKMKVNIHEYMYRIFLLLHKSRISCGSILPKMVQFGIFLCSGVW